MDSTILNRVGKRLEPDEKLQKATQGLKELMESKEFKSQFKKQSQKKLQAIKWKNTYYKKFQKPNLDLAKKPLEEALRPKKCTAEESSIIKDKICMLEFQFKRLNILCRRPKLSPSLEQLRMRKK
ncbi:uncharacterized protein NEMAJ01_0114 [Nematocida major]|uniref:uncharacterized protein n=1 Tax=Nematocida major TaxID=1912982 RepID=UPI0020078AE0|nr:uncharacterized protein NEMAJ01_0114 [Nematocida major]KAH9385218.1 hypothetical protein NEMAJ01_0114 [Nematocida major]